MWHISWNKNYNRCLSLLKEYMRDGLTKTVFMNFACSLTFYLCIYRLYSSSGYLGSSWGSVLSTINTQPQSIPTEKSSPSHRKDQFDLEILS